MSNTIDAPYLSTMSESNNSGSSTADELPAELQQFCKSDSLSEEGLRTIIAKYGLTPDHKMYDGRTFRNAFFFAACYNKRVTEEIIRLLIEYFPNAPRAIDQKGNPLHVACLNEKMTVNMIQLLIEAAPDSVRLANENGDLPIHFLCYGTGGNEQVKMEMLKFLLDEYPELIRQSNNKGNLPLHHVAQKRSPEFCQLLVESHPESVRVGNNYGGFPLHGACAYNNFPAVEYLYNLYPDAINYVTSSGYYPIHCAIVNGKGERRAALDIVRFLLNCDPGVKLQKYEGESLLHYACMCMQNVGDSNENVEACVQMIEAIYDANPESIRYADEKGDLPIHLCCCGSVVNEIVKVKVLKLLLDKYPESTRHTDNGGFLPLHDAAQKRSPEFCRILVESYPESVRVRNSDGVLPLNYACALNTLPTVEYLYSLYPDAINHATPSSGYYPIHYAMMNVKGRRRAALDIVRFLLNCDPRVKLQSWKGESLLTFACMQDFGVSNEDVEACVQMIEAINDAHPESIRCINEFGCLPIHHLCCCYTQKVMKEEKVAMAILKLLLDKYPESIRNTGNEGNLPLHYACNNNKSPEFCQLLIESYPDSVRVSNSRGELPLHFACYGNILPTVEFIYKLDPEAANRATTEGLYPIHLTIMGAIAMTRRDAQAALGIVQLLLDCDPRVKLQKYQSKSLLFGSCALEYTDANVETGIQMIKAIYDAYPEAIEEDSIVPNIEVCHEQVQAFINGEMIYARKARDHRLMMTPDENGQLPLHRALQNNVRLGSIKLLLNGNIFAARSADNNGSLPLHLACEYHDSPRVIEHLIDLHPTTLQRIDSNQNTVLHYACRGANYSAIALLLDKYDATSVSIRNVHNELPMDLLFKSSAVEGREGIEYTDCVFRLLRAFPEAMTMKRGTRMGRTSLVISSSPRHVGKKRKFSNE